VDELVSPPGKPLMEFIGEVFTKGSFEIIGLSGLRTPRRTIPMESAERETSAVFLKNIAFKFICHWFRCMAS
jgi:hypothetical protein